MHILPTLLRIEHIRALIDFYPMFLCGFKNLREGSLVTHPVI